MPLYVWSFAVILLANTTYNICLTLQRILYIHFKHCLPLANVLHVVHTAHTKRYKLAQFNIAPLPLKQSLFLYTHTCACACLTPSLLRVRYIYLYIGECGRYIFREVFLGTFIRCSQLYIYTRANTKPC